MIGLFKTELIKPRGPWRTVEQVEIATLEYVDWFNHRRLFEACGDIPPAELEGAHYRQQAALTEAGHPQLQVSGHAGAVHSVFSAWSWLLLHQPTCLAGHDAVGAYSPGVSKWRG